MQAYLGKRPSHDLERGLDPVRRAVGRSRPVGPSSQSGCFQHISTIGVRCDLRSRQIVDRRSGTAVHRNRRSPEPPFTGTAVDQDRPVMASLYARNHRRPTVLPRRMSNGKDVLWDLPSKHVICPGE